MRHESLLSHKKIERVEGMKFDDDVGWPVIGQDSLITDGLGERVFFSDGIVLRERGTLPVGVTYQPQTYLGGESVCSEESEVVKGQDLTVTSSSHLPRVEQTVEGYLMNLRKKDNSQQMLESAVGRLVKDVTTGVEGLIESVNIWTGHRPWHSYPSHHVHLFTLKVAGKFIGSRTTYFKADPSRELLPPMRIIKIPKYESDLGVHYDQRDVPDGSIVFPTLSHLVHTCLRSVPHTRYRGLDEKPLTVDVVEQGYEEWLTKLPTLKLGDPGLVMKDIRYQLQEHGIDDTPVQVHNKLMGLGFSLVGVMPDTYYYLPRVEFRDGSEFFKWWATKGDRGSRTFQGERVEFLRKMFIFEGYQVSSTLSLNGVNLTWRKKAGTG